MDKEDFRICVVCGKSFLPRRYDQKTCSNACSLKYKRKPKGPRQIGAMSQQRACVVCGTLFTPKSPSQKTCSNACSRERHRRYELARRDLPREIYAQTHPDAFQKKCVICGKIFYTKRESRKTCSQACSVRLRWLNGHSPDRASEKTRRALITWNNNHTCPAPRGSNIDEYGFRVPFAPSSRCPLVDDGKISADELLNLRNNGDPSIVDICSLRFKDRQRFTGAWTNSEYQLARRYMKEKGLK